MKINHAPEILWQDPLDFVAAGFGSGAMPIAPGTFGTLAAIPFYYFLSQFSNATYGIITLICVILGIYICDRAGKRFGVVDHSAIVWDEFASFLIVMFMIPVTWYFVLMGFLLFRLFDIWKPWPICYLDEHLPGGWGVMLDDVAAGIISWAILFVISRWV